MSFCLITPRRSPPRPAILTPTVGQPDAMRTMAGRQARADEFCQKSCGIRCDLKSWPVDPDRRQFKTTPMQIHGPRTHNKCTTTRERTNHGLHETANVSQNVSTSRSPEVGSYPCGKPHAARKHIQPSAMPRMCFANLRNNTKVNATMDRGPEVSLHRFVHPNQN